MSKQTSKTKTPAKENGVKQSAAPKNDLPMVKYEPNKGALYPETDENSVMDYKGRIHLPEPGEYWLHGFMKKDTSGILFMDLNCNHRADEIEAKDIDRGVLFRNNRKRLKHQPDYTGNIFVEVPGEYALLGVIEESKSKVKYMALEVVNESAETIAETDLPF